MSKLIFIDVDGTLVDYSGRLPASAVPAIRRARANGHRVYISTGRSRAEVYPNIWEIGLDGMIGGNGSYVEDHEQVVLHQLVTADQCREIVDWLHERGLEFYLESNSGLYASEKFEQRGEPAIREYSATKGKANASALTVRDVFPDMIFGGELYRDDVNKISYVLDSYQDYLDACERFPYMKNGTWGGKGETALFGDIGVPNISKAYAIQKLVEHLGADMADTIAFGDAKVDIPMFECCNYSVCMGSGGEEAKAAADYVTDNVERDGLLKAFIKLGLFEGRLLFFDIDGTLVPGGAGSPSERVVEAVRKARENGNLAFISTGRSESMVDEAIKAIGFDGGIFSAGGRVTFRGEEICNYPLTEEKLSEIMSVLNAEPTVFYLLECDHDNFKGNMDPDFLLNEARNVEGASSELKRIMSVLFKSGQRDAKDYDGTPVYKVSFFSFNHENMQKVVEKLGELGKVVTFENMMPDSPIRSGEISDWNTNKGVALKKICEYLDASIEDTIAFGDSMNDAEIMMAAGIGVGMGNAEPGIKAISDVICESVEEDGVALELERMKLI